MFPIDQQGYPWQLVHRGKQCANKKTFSTRYAHVSSGPVVQFHGQERHMKCWKSLPSKQASTQGHVESNLILQNLSIDLLSLLFEIFNALNQFVVIVLQRGTLASHFTLLLGPFWSAFVVCQISLLALVEVVKVPKSLSLELCFFSVRTFCG